jgi:hypothetical protein
VQRPSICFCKRADLLAEANALLANFSKSSPTKKGKKIVEIDKAEAGVAEALLTATPSAPAPRSKLNNKIKFGKRKIALSIHRKKQANAVKTAEKMDDAKAMLASSTV